MLSWWKWPVSNEMPAYKAAAACGDGRSPSARAMSHTSSLVLLARPRTKFSSPYSGLSWWWSMFDGHVTPARQRQPLRVAGVERVQRGVGRRRAATHAPGRQQFVGERQQLVLGDPQLRLHAQLPEQVEHAGRRAERVGVGLLVHGERHESLAAHATAQGVEVRRELVHDASSSPCGASDPPASSAGSAAAASSVSMPGTGISCGSSPSTWASRLSARSRRRALSSVSS